MRKILLILLAIISIVGVFLFVKNPQLVNAANKVTKNCLTITGTFNAKNWTGGPMMVGCGGDNGRFCKGDVEKVYPGKKYTLTACSCPPYASGCLVVGKKLVLKNDGPNNRPRVTVKGDRVPKSCVLKVKNNVCGTNGNTITGNFKVICKGPTPTNTPTPTITNTPTPTSSICVPPEPVLNVKITCPNCQQTGGDITVTPTITPTSVPPTFTPTPTGHAGAFCGGIGNVQCAAGFSCNITDNSHPDASGTCVAGDGGGRR